VGRPGRSARRAVRPSRPTTRAGDRRLTLPGGSPPDVLSRPERICGLEGSSMRPPLATNLIQRVLVPAARRGPLRGLPVEQLGFLMRARVLLRQSSSSTSRSGTFSRRSGAVAGRPDPSARGKAA
jgi:hypothetical protein